MKDCHYLGDGHARSMNLEPLKSCHFLVTTLWHTVIMSSSGRLRIAVALAAAGVVAVVDKSYMARQLHKSLVPRQNMEI